MTDLASLVVRMQADNSQYVKALDQATQRLSKFSDEQGKLFKELGDKIIAAFTIDAIVEFTTNIIEAASSLEKLSQAAGISVEQLSGLQVAAAASGTSQDDMAGSLKKLNIAIADAAGNDTSKAAFAFQALGISVKNADGSIKSAGQLLPEIADKYATLADGPNKVAINTILFGKAASNLIPTLNGGSQALNEFQAQADAAGITMSAGLAKAADEVSAKFAILKLSFTQGFGGEVLTAILPTLNAFADGLKSIGQAGGDAKGTLQLFLPVLGAIGAVILEAVTEFKLLASAITGAGQVIEAVAHGQFAKANDIMNKQHDDAVRIRAAGNAAILKLINAGGEEQSAALIAAAEKTKAAQASAATDQGVSPEALQKQHEAVVKLQEFTDGLKVQAQSFGLGSAAAINYKLQFGPLADALKLAGKEGQALAASARAYALELQKKQDTKAVDDYTNKLQEQVTKYGQSSVAAADYATHSGELGKALDRLGAAGETARAHIHALAVEQIQLKNDDAFKSIDNQLLTLSGHLADAAKLAFEFQNRVLIKDTAAVGTESQKAQLSALEAATVAQARFNEEQEKAAVIQQNLATTEAQVELARSNGQITDLQAEAQLNAARQAAIAQLNQIKTVEQQIADSSGIPKLQQETIAFGNSISAVQVQTDKLAKSIRDDLENDASNAFLSIETGAKSAKAAIADFFKDLEKQLLEMANKNIAQSIFGTGGAGGGISGALAGLFGGGGGGGGGGAGLASFFGSLFGGGKSGAIPGVVQNAGLGGGIGNIVGSLEGFASGGTIGAGDMAIVGEHGPELAYSGAKDLNIVPGGMGRQVHVTNNFMVPAQGGQISRASQMQTAAAAARSLQQASRRNNT